MNDRISVGQAGLNSRRHALYRFFDQSDVLLYVGITVDIGARFKKHRGDKPWWEQVDHINIEHFATRREAEDAERRAIKTEQPLHNVVHNEFTLAEPSDTSALSLAREILYGLWGIKPGDGEYELAAAAARVDAADENRPLRDMDIEVVCQIASAKYFECVTHEMDVRRLAKALPAQRLNRYTAEIESRLGKPAVDADFADVANVLITQLTEDIAWSTLGELDTTTREYWLEFARQRAQNTEHGFHAVDAVRYYHDSENGLLDQTIAREDKNRQAWEGRG